MADTDTEVVAPDVVPPAVTVPTDSAVELSISARCSVCGATATVPRPTGLNARHWIDLVLGPQVEQALRAVNGCQHF
jgi:hypothetical protein